MKPTTHQVEFYDLEKVKAVEARGPDALEVADIDELYSFRDFADEKAARAFVAELEAADPSPWWRIWERYDIEDGTPGDEPVRGLVWDYEERILVECGEDQTEEETS